MIDIASKTVGKPRGRPFTKGNTANPRGRPQGSRNSATILLQKLMDGEGEEITRAVIDLAKDGNETAMRLCLERLIPVRKDRPIRLKLPQITTAAGVGEATNVLLQSVARGEITPAEAASVTALLESRRKSIETTELEARITAIEQGGVR